MLSPSEDSVFRLRRWMASRRLARCAFNRRPMIFKPCVAPAHNLFILSIASQWYTISSLSEYNLLSVIFRLAGRNITDKGTEIHGLRTFKAGTKSIGIHIESEDANVLTTIIAHSVADLAGAAHDRAGVGDWPGRRLFRHAVVQSAQPMPRGTRDLHKLREFLEDLGSRA